MTVRKRLSAAEAARYKGMDVRRCASCQTIFTRDKIPDNFAPDSRTSDSYSRLCLDCLLLRDKATARRDNETKASYASRQRADIRATRQASANALIQAALPEHAIPRFSFDDYPTPLLPTDTPRTPARAARLTWLYGKLLDSGATTWEQVSKLPRHRIRQNIDFGVGSFDAIDEHLVALGLPPLKP